MADYVPLRKRLQQLIQPEPLPSASAPGADDELRERRDDAPVTELANSSSPAQSVQEPPQPEPSEHIVIAVPLDLLVIDPHQPRQYLPADLRAHAARHEQSAQNVMAALIERAASNDVEATGYLDSLAPLARSIAAVGLLQPIRVSMDTRTDGRRAFSRREADRPPDRLGAPVRQSV